MEADDVQQLRAQIAAQRRAAADLSERLIDACERIRETTELLTQTETARLDALRRAPDTAADEG